MSNAAKQLQAAYDVQGRLAQVFDRVAFIGGTAINVVAMASGSKSVSARSTHDLDIVVDPQNINESLRKATGLGFTPERGRKENLHLIDRASGMRIDLFYSRPIGNELKIGIEEILASAVERTAKMSGREYTFSVANPALLVLSKWMAGRRPDRQESDFSDIARVITSEYGTTEEFLTREMPVLAAHVPEHKWEAFVADIKGIKR